MMEIFPRYIIIKYLREERESIVGPGLTYEYPCYKFITYYILPSIRSCVIGVGILEVYHFQGDGKSRLNCQTLFEWKKLTFLCSSHFL